jgi:hypothetical protein
MKKGDWIFLGKNNRVDLMCQVTKVKVDEIYFTVETGGWDGIFYPSKKEIYICFTRRRSPKELLYDIQDRLGRGGYNYAIDKVNERIRSGSPCIRESTSGYASEDCCTDIRPPAFRSDTADEKISKTGKLRRVLLSPTRYLVIDIQHREVRLFERQNKRNVFLRSMPL